MPNLGFDADTAVLIEWLKQPGDVVRRGEALALVESDKADVELEATSDGVLLEVLVSAGTAVSIGAVIARVGQAGESIASTAPPPTAASAARLTPVAQRMISEHGIDPTQISGAGSKITRGDVAAHLAGVASSTDANDMEVLALPIVRKAARAHGIDLHALRAAGFANPIKLADLDQFAQTQTVPEPGATQPEAGVTDIPLTRIRQRIAERMTQSAREAPHFQVGGAFDFDPALRRLREIEGANINDLIGYLTVQTLLRVPALNATFERDTIRRYDAVHLAIAIARDDGLVTPVIRDAQRYSLTGLAEAGRALIERARSNRFQPDDLLPGTFTISNLGIVPQVDQFTAVINPPQVAILAVGRLKPRPVVIDGGLHVRNTAYLTLSGDHRAVDGIDLARWLEAFQAELDRFAR